MVSIRATVVVVCAWALACASAIPADRAEIRGRLTLVPHEQANTGGGAYGDRRLRSAELVDYSRPGFSVVYLERPEVAQPIGEDQAASTAEQFVEIVGGRVGARVSPSHAAIPMGARVVIRNRDRRPHVVSSPRAGLLRSLDAGQSTSFIATRPGEYLIFIASDATASAVLFSAPGPFAVPASSGRFALRDLAPGRWTMRAWHPRFPPVAQELELQAGQSIDVDVSIGVGRSAGVRP